MHNKKAGETIAGFDMCCPLQDQAAAGGHAEVEPILDGTMRAQPVAVPPHAARVDVGAPLLDGRVPGRGVLAVGVGADQQQVLHVVLLVPRARAARSSP